MICHQIERKSGLKHCFSRSFCGCNADEILGFFDDGTIDIAQLHGSESEEYIKNLKEKTDNQLKIINAIEMNECIDLEKYDNSQGRLPTFGQR